MDAREQTLDAATRLFAAQGYGGTSLSAIADAVGIRKASLLYHFPSKDALHRAVLDQILEHWSQVLPRLLEAAAGDDRFDALLHEVVQSAPFINKPRQKKASAESPKNSIKTTR